jgi:hypothetical protein
MVSSIYKIVCLVHYEFMIHKPYTPKESVQVAGTTLVEESFQASGNGFIAKSAKGEDFTISNPIYNIASIAISKDRLRSGTSLELPEGYDVMALREIALKTSYSDKEVFISRQQAIAFADLGDELLWQNAHGSFKDDLGYFETVSIAHLQQQARLVGETALRA